MKCKYFGQEGKAEVLKLSLTIIREVGFGEADEQVLLHLIWCQIFGTHRTVETW